MNNDGKREGKLINCELTITHEKGLHFYRSLGVRRTAFKRPRSKGKCEALKNHVLIKNVHA